MLLKELDHVFGIVNWIMGKLGIKWFACFGTLLGMIRDDGPIKDDHDIDIGIFYEDTDEVRLVNGFSKWNYKLAKKTINDYELPNKPFHMSFVSNQKMPELCVFAWYKHKDYRYHTYDVNQENKPVPSEYVFKGVPGKLLSDIIQFNPTVKGNIMFQRPPYVPLKYGTILDIWYPNWKVPKGGQSETPYIVKMKSCKQWDKINVVHNDIG